MTLTKKDSTLLIAIFLLIIILIGMSGCGAPHYLRKSQRALKKAIQKGAVINPDTVFQTVTVTVPGVRTDSVFVPGEGDTVVIEKDRLQIRYINLPGDTVEISGKCAPDTVIKKIPYTVTQNVTVPVKDNKWKWIAIGLGMLLLVIFLVRLAPITR